LTRPRRTTRPTNRRREPRTRWPAGEGGPRKRTRRKPGTAPRPDPYTSIWVADHGWVYLNAIIDCCTREIVGWQLSLRCRAVEAIAVIDQAVREQAILPGTLTLGTDNGADVHRADGHWLAGYALRPCLDDDPRWAGREVTTLPATRLSGVAVLAGGRGAFV